MDQEKMVDELGDRVVDLLPDEAIDELLGIPNDDGRDERVREVLARYGVDVNAMAKSLVEEKNNG